MFIWPWLGLYVCKCVCACAQAEAVCGHRLVWLQHHCEPLWLIPPFSRLYGEWRHSSVTVRFRKDYCVVFVNGRETTIVGFYRSVWCSCVLWGSSHVVFGSSLSSSQATSLFSLLSIYCDHTVPLGFDCGVCVCVWCGYV